MIRSPIRSVFKRLIRRPTEQGGTAPAASTGALMVDSYQVLVDSFPIVFS